MLTKHTNRGLTWIDLESPTQDEIRTIAKDYNLNPLVVHELSSPTLKPKVDLYQNYIYLILHFPRLRRNKEEHDQEIDFIIGKKFLITVRYNANETLHYVSKMFETSATLDKGTFGPHAGFIFFLLLGKLYESLIQELGAVRTSLRSIEDRIYSGEEREMVMCLSGVSRDLLYLRRSLSLHRDVLESFEIAGQKLLGASFAFHLRTLVGDFARVEQLVTGNVEFLSELRETNNALLSTKQHEIMKTFTILAFIALPATTVLSLFQINTVSRPIVGVRFDFWILVLMVGGIAFGLYTWFKYKKWL
ncbi:MAG: CorA family divalent cation transporter [bacterium]|nr:CorA family divalent cation transporter [bacterium]